MTEEQYQEVISLDKRLNELETCYIHLSYCRLCNFGDLSPIKDILTRIKREMESIKKQISEI